MLSYLEHTTFYLDLHSKEKMCLPLMSFINFADIGIGKFWSHLLGRPEHKNLWTSGNSWTHFRISLDKYYMFFLTQNFSADIICYHIQCFKLSSLHPYWSSAAFQMCFIRWTGDRRYTIQRAQLPSYFIFFANKVELSINLCVEHCKSANWFSYSHGICSIPTLAFSFAYREKRPFVKPWKSKNLITATLKYLD